MKKRVKIPAKDAKSLLDLVAKVRTKHEQDGELSPLKVLDWSKLNSTIDKAIEIEERAFNHKREKLTLFEKRAQSLLAVAEIVRSSRDVLIGVHRDQPKTLGLWGFDVLDSRVMNSSEPELNNSTTSV
jgi:hypothetical protein